MHRHRHSPSLAQISYEQRYIQRVDLAGPKAYYGSIDCHKNTVNNLQVKLNDPCEITEVSENIPIKTI